MSGQRTNSGPSMNGTYNNYRRHINSYRMPGIPLERRNFTQHDDVIRFIQGSWSKVSQEVNRKTVLYYQEQEPEILKHFEPFNLEAYYGRRAHQHIQYPHRMHNS